MRRDAGWQVVACLAALLLGGGEAWARGAQQLLERYAQEAKQADPDFSGFSAEEGRKFYLEKHPLMGVGAVSCASCHRKNPREHILAHRTDILCRACHVINDKEHPDPQHAKKRTIEPLAPSANARRFGDAERSERFFRTNCRLVVKRDCTAVEKGNLVTWLLTLEGGPIYHESLHGKPPPDEE